MEPIKASLIVVQFLMPVLGKIGETALGKMGETLGENSLKQAGKLMQLVHRKSPDTASAIEAAAKSPELVEQQPEIYSTAALAAKVEELKKSDEEIAAAVEALADLVVSQPSIVQNFTKTAEKISNNYQGYVFIHHQENKL